MNTEVNFAVWRCVRQRTCGCSLDPFFRFRRPLPIRSTRRSVFKRELITTQATPQRHDHMSDHKLSGC